MPPTEGIKVSKAGIPGNSSNLQMTAWFADDSEELFRPSFGELSTGGTKLCEVRNGLEIYW